MPFTVHPHPTGGYVIAVLGRTPLPAIFDSRAQAQDAADYLSTRPPRPAAPAPLPFDAGAGADIPTVTPPSYRRWRKKTTHQTMRTLDRCETRCMMGFSDKPIGLVHMTQRGAPPARPHRAGCVDDTRPLSNHRDARAPRVVSVPGAKTPTST
jgi:hypothetical protein